MFTVSTAVLARSSLTTIQQGHLGGPVDQASMEYLHVQSQSAGRTWCIVSLKQIQNNLCLVHGIKRCIDDISDHLHRLADLGYVEIQKRTARNKDGSLFTGRNLYKLTPLFYNSLDRAGRKLARLLTGWWPWKKRPSAIPRPVKTPDSTCRLLQGYSVGDSLKAPPRTQEEQKGGPRGNISSESPPRRFEEGLVHIREILKKLGD